MRIRAKYIKVGDIIEAPSMPKVYDFPVISVTETKHNVIIMEDCGRRWVMPKEQWVEVRI